MRSSLGLRFFLSVQSSTWGSRSKKYGQKVIVHSVEKSGYNVRVGVRQKTNHKQLQLGFRCFRSLLSSSQPYRDGKEVVSRHSQSNASRSTLRWIGTTRVLLRALTPICHSVVEQLVVPLAFRGETSDLLEVFFSSDMLAVAVIAARGHTYG